MYRKCPICKSERGEKLRTINMYKMGEENPLPHSYDVACCSQCGFTYADVAVSQKEYDEYYRNCNMYAHNASLKMKAEERLAEFEQVYILFADKIDEDTRILDIGCGNGDFLEYLQHERGTKKGLCGLDPSEEAVAILKEKGIDGICSGIFDPVNTQKKEVYDVVLSMGVIEHIYDLENYIYQITQYMRKDKKSFFLCVCPSVEGFEKNLYAIPNYFNQEHINYFSKESLDNLLNQFQLFRVNENVYVDIGNESNQEQVIMALYEMRNKTHKLQYDGVSGTTIKNYFKKVAGKERQLEQSVRELLAISKRLVIWGCGAYAMQIISQYPELIEKAECFVDNNPAKQGIKIGDKIVCSPEEIKNIEGSVIAVCSMMNVSDIKNQIEDLVSDCTVIVL